MTDSPPPFSHPSDCLAAADGRCSPERAAPAFADASRFPFVANESRLQRLEVPTWPQEPPGHPMPPPRPPRDPDDDEAPETPLDEPPPLPVEDPPAEPDEPPLVV